jgi:hypothetical protein
MNIIFRMVMAAIGTTLLFSHSHIAAAATDTPPLTTQPQQPDSVCAADRSPYRDLDFLVGSWEFFTQDGKKIADQTYSSRGQGCLILEDWTELSGATGTGMNFVDPTTGKWRQVWMSSSFHIDYSGGLSEKGHFVLEGHIYPNNGGPASAFKGVYIQQSDGSVTKEFLIYDGKTKTWQRFFIGVARRKI